MELLVVGAGSMGRWVAATVRSGATDAVDVAFADAESSTAAVAAAVHDGPARTVDLDGEERFDVVCLAVPISAVEDAVAAQAPRARSGMVDVTGVMAGPLSAMRESLPNRERVSLHPLFAPENAPGTVACVADRSGPATTTLLDALAAEGNRVFDTTADEHDTAMETVQAGAHAAVLAFALAAEDVDEAFHTPVSAALTDVVETVTGGTPRVYREIQETFPGADRVADAARRLADADAAQFEALYEELSGSPAAGRVTEPTTDDEDAG